MTPTGLVVTTEALPSLPVVPGTMGPLMVPLMRAWVPMTAMLRRAEVVATVRILVVVGCVGVGVVVRMRVRVSCDGDRCC